MSNAIGTALVIVTATCCEPTSDTVTVSVIQEVASVAVDPSSVSLTTSETKQVTADAQDANGYTIPGASFTWSSSDISVVSVTDGGSLTAEAEGTAVVTALYDGAEGTTSVNVDDGTVDDGTEPTSSAERPNEPNWGADGMVWLQHDMRSLPSGAASHAGYFSTDYGENYSIGQSADFPHGARDVLVIRYPEGLADGTSPGRFFGHDVQSESTALSEWYVSVWVKLDGADWEVPPNELKLWYNGIGNRSRPSRGGKVSLAHGGSANSFSSAFERLRVSTRANDSSVSQNHDSSPVSFTVGDWHLIEFYGKASTPGLNDGVVRIHLNGTKILEETGIQNQDEPDWDIGFFEFHWAPVWGGKCTGGCPRTRDDTMRLADLYVSGRPQG